MIEVANAVIRIVNEAISKVEKGEDVKAVAKTCASAYGVAISEAYADVLVELKSTSKHGKGCGSAFSDAASTATAFALVVVDVRPLHVHRPAAVNAVLSRCWPRRRIRSHSLAQGVLPRLSRQPRRKHLQRQKPMPVAKASSMPKSSQVLLEKGSPNHTPLFSRSLAPPQRRTLLWRRSFLTSRLAFSKRAIRMEAPSLTSLARVSLSGTP